MDERFTIVVEPESSLVRITTRGFFTLGDAERLRDRLVVAYRALRCAPNAHRTLVDVRAMAIQSQDTLQLFAGVFARPDLRAKALAVVTAKTLARMQMARITEGRNVRFFDNDVAAAERWLFEQKAHAA